MIDTSDYPDCLRVILWKEKKEKKKKKGKKRKLLKHVLETCHRKSRQREAQPCKARDDVCVNSREIRIRADAITHCHASVVSGLGERNV